MQKIKQVNKPRAMVDSYDLDWLTIIMLGLYFLFSLFTDTWRRGTVPPFKAKVNERKQNKTEKNKKRTRNICRSFQSFSEGGLRH